jgi:methionyl-tRNA synthetase
MMYQTQTANVHMLWILLLLVTREMVRKGFALWGAGTKKKPIWFICLFILNTLGILPIIYLIFFNKENKKAKK